MLNNGSFGGRVGRDATLRDAGSTKVLNFSLANNTGFGDREVTTWFNVSYFGRSAEKLEQHIKKGTFLNVSGEVKMNKYTGNDGVEKQSLELRAHTIDFVPGGRSNNENNENEQEEDSDSIPF